MVINKDAEFRFSVVKRVSFKITSLFFLFIFDSCVYFFCFLCIND